MELKKGKNMKFKYISCSYLSFTDYWKYKNMLAFKYISCSYLSGSECEMAITEDNLNTSHVLIYQI